MTQTKETTSRHWILDAIECIKNCEAIVSHCNEIMDSIHDNVTKNDEVYSKYENLKNMKEIATKTRRRVMNKISQSFDNTDHQMRCIVKHSVAAKWFIDEVADASVASFVWNDDKQDLYKLMSLAISSFIWEEPQVCARCMADALFDKEEDKESESEPANEVNYWPEDEGLKL